MQTFVAFIPGIARLSGNGLKRVYQAFKEWEKRFDRPIWWILAVVVFLPMFGIALSAMTN